jgi:hypothetical protein
MSAKGQQQTCAVQNPMSASPHGTQNEPDIK